MKEFCLIPKNVAERFLNHSHSSANDENNNNSNSNNNNNNDNNNNNSLNSSTHKKEKGTISDKLKTQSKKKNIKKVPETDGKRKKRRRSPKATAPVVVGGVKVRKKSFPLQQQQQQQQQQQRRRGEMVHFRGERDKYFPYLEPMTIQSNPNFDPRPSLDHLVNLTATATQKDYMRSMLSLLRNTAAVAWDSEGNLIEPVRNFNVIDILKTLSNASDRHGFSKADLPFIKLFLRAAGVNSSLIRSVKARKQLMGGSKSFRDNVFSSPNPSLSRAQAQRMPWETYRV